jgi:hypothetical protein
VHACLLPRVVPQRCIPAGVPDRRAAPFEGSPVAPIPGFHRNCSQANELTVGFRHRRSSGACIFAHFPPPASALNAHHAAVLRHGRTGQSWRSRPGVESAELQHASARGGKPAVSGSGRFARWS